MHGELDIANPAHTTLEFVVTGKALGPCLHRSDFAYRLGPERLGVGERDHRLREGRTQRRISGGEARLEHGLALPCRRPLLPVGDI